MDQDIVVWQHFPERRREAVRAYEETLHAIFVRRVARLREEG